jgi:AAA+ superfamily predicted ATPase
LKNNESNTPKGIHRVQLLPNKGLGELWDSIVVDQGMKDRLLSQALVNFTVRPRVSRTVLPLHGAILLIGAPGTGKTSLAKGLANRIAETITNKKFTLVEVNPHVLGSSMMGKTQKAVSELFSQSIAEAAVAGPTIVLLDEVETLAADRRKMSLEANPIDVHRATDAVLVQLDALAEDHDNLLFLATSNFPQAVDGAFTSRCDLVIEVPLPGKGACERILTSCLEGMGSTFSSIGLLPRVSGYSKAVDELVGLDGRAIRKVVANALANRKEVALNPQEMTVTDLIDAARRASATRAPQRHHV